MKQHTRSPDGNVRANGLEIRSFEWQFWPDLWNIRSAQLTEHGIPIEPDDYPTEPDLNSPYEWDYHRIESIYLRDAGNFWLAWLKTDPAGHVAALDAGGVVELRHMYVKPAYRRRGIGNALVATLLNHCCTHHIPCVELWTSVDDVGRLLYASMGFYVTLQPGPGYENADAFTRYQPGDDEIRMRIEFH